jgi:hypothetical protein
VLLLRARAWRRCLRPWRVPATCSASAAACGTLRTQQQMVPLLGMLGGRVQESSGWRQTEKVVAVSTSSKLCLPHLAARVSPLSVDELLSKPSALSLASEELSEGEPAAALRAVARPEPCDAGEWQGGVVWLEKGESGKLWVADSSCSLPVASWLALQAGSPHRSHCCSHWPCPAHQPVSFCC